jgi:hypothetical protein
MRMIDLTPTWSGVWRVLIEVARNGTTQEAREAARGELCRMTGMEQDELLELIEAALAGRTHELRHEAMRRFSVMAAMRDDANEEAKQDKQGGNDGE